MKLVFWVLERVSDREDKFSRKYRDLMLDELKKDRELLLGKEVYFLTTTTGSWHQEINGLLLPPNFLFLVGLECRMHELQLGRKFSRGKG